MAKINIKQLKPGMVLSEDAVHANGRVLLKAGSVIAENHIKIFKTWGVTNFTIKSELDQADSGDKTYSPAEINHAISRKRAIFKYCDSQHDFIKALFRLSVKVSLAKHSGEK